MNINNVTSLLNKPFVLGYQLRPAIETLAHSVCGYLALDQVTVIWDSHTSTASMDHGGNMRIATPADDAKITRNIFTKYVGFVIHELLHRKYTQFSMLRFGSDGMKVGNNQYLRALHNAIEDAWIERKGIAEGFTGNIESVLHTLIKVMLQDCKVSDWADPAVYPFSLAVYARRYPVSVPVPGAVKPIFDEACRMIDASKSTGENIHIAKWVYDQLRKVDESQPEDDSQGDDSRGEDSQDSEGDQQGDGAEGDQQGDGADDGAGEGSGEGSGEGAGEGEGEGNGSGSGSDAGEGGGEGSGSPSEGPQGDEQGQGEGEGAPQPAKGSQKPGPARRFDANTKPVEVEPTVHPGAGNVGPGTFNSERHVYRDGFHAAYAEHEINSSANAALKNLLRRAFENTDTTEFDKGRKAGAFDVKAVKRWATGSTNIFQRRQEKGGIESAVIILIDCSSSMNAIVRNKNGRSGATRMTLAKECAAAIYESLDAAGVSTGVYTFCDGASVAAPIGTSFRKARKTLSRIGINGGTNDFQAVQFAHQALLAQHQERKVLLVLTDGAGNTCAVKRQCESAQKLGITTIGIGIGIDADCYPVHARVDSATELAQSALGKLIAAARV